MPPCILSASLLLPIPLHVAMVRMRLSLYVLHWIVYVNSSKNEEYKVYVRGTNTETKKLRERKKDLDLRCIENICYYCYDFLFTHFFFFSWYVLLFLCCFHFDEDEVVSMKDRDRETETKTQREREHSSRCSSKIGSSCPLHARRTNEIFCCVCCCYCWYIFSGVIILIDWPLSLKLPILYESISTEYCSSSHFYGYSFDY